MGQLLLGLLADKRMAGWVLADYFPGIPEALRQAGNRVLVASLSPMAGVAERARQLKDLLDRAFPGEPVHLFGHSMGCLDSRYLISRLDMARRVLSLTTIGTPHRGSSFAEASTVSPRWCGRSCPSCACPTRRSMT